MPLLVAHAPENAHHLIFTYSHEIDLALCAALLKRGAASIGLIGSETKRARFAKRLRAMNLDPAHIICPIGDKSLGKRPDEIAHGTLCALLSNLQSKVLP
jgi:xanthine dehydrogenase accessory factor